MGLDWKRTRRRCTAAPSSAQSSARLIGERMRLRTTSVLLIDVWRGAGVRVAVDAKRRDAIGAAGRGSGARRVHRRDQGRRQPLTRQQRRAAGCGCRRAAARRRRAVRAAGAAPSRESRLARGLQGALQVSARGPERRAQGGAAHHAADGGQGAGRQVPGVGARSGRHRGAAREPNRDGTGPHDAALSLGLVCGRADAAALDARGSGGDSRSAEPVSAGREAPAALSGRSQDRQRGRRRSTRF